MTRGFFGGWTKAPAEEILPPLKKIADVLKLSEKDARKYLATLAVPDLQSLLSENNSFNESAFPVDVREEMLGRSIWLTTEIIHILKKKGVEIG